jgi:small subunit ribosomal protein S11
MAVENENEKSLKKEKPLNLPKEEEDKGGEGGSTSDVSSSGDTGDAAGGAAGGAAGSVSLGPGEEVAIKKSSRRKKLIAEGNIYIKSSGNNAIVTVTDTHGNTFAWASTVSAGSLRSQKKTPFSAGLAVESAVKKALERGLREAKVYISGVGMGRDMALKRLAIFPQLMLTAIIDRTPIPHNGCRPPKRRRT